MKQKAKRHNTFENIKQAKKTQEIYASHNNFELQMKELMGLVSEVSETKVLNNCLV